MVVVNGNPAISYSDIGNGLKYVRATDADGSNWGVPETVLSTGYFFSYPTLVMVDGNPAVSYGKFDIWVADLVYVTMF